MHHKKLIIVIGLLSLVALACAGLSLPSAGDLVGNVVGTALATSGLDEFVQMATMLADSGLSEDAQNMAATMMAGGTAFPLETLMAQFGEQASGAVIYTDDFSDESTGWPIDFFTEGATSYDNGEYRITVNETNYAVWASSGSGNYSAISAEVDAVMIGGPQENEFGLLCRFVDNNNFYAATIASDGYYFIWRRINGGDWELVGMESGEFSEAIRTGSESNRIRLDCIDSAITLYANGMQLVQVFDSSLTSGDVGLYAGSFDVGGVDVVFDNFVVSQP
ncbi:MAG TPA: hypothetical protein PLC52_03955 [Anaerolineales bacterium]|nr:hypothetical protein [Anaerolineales bacterium]HRQ92003.1 hypothetical protein [Anaerolineales bacterium]